MVSVERTMSSQPNIPSIQYTHHQRLYQTTNLSAKQPQSIRLRRPFDSPNPSTSSLNDTDGGASTSEQDEFHLERYSSDAKYHHLRQISNSSNGEIKDRKPDLNIVTKFSGPNMPMKSEAVLVNEVQGKQLTESRKNKALSVVSHRAIQATASPPDQDAPSPPLPFRRSTRDKLVKHSKRGKPTQRLPNAIAQRWGSPLTQRIPIGITIPQGDAARLDQTITDSALPSVTPMTPAIVVTPAGEQRPWLLQHRGTDALRRPASSIYSAMPTDNPLWDPSTAPPLPRSIYDEKLRDPGQRTSFDSGEPILDSADANRPKSQGWWNLMLSPLLRAGSIASRKGRPHTETAPVPPLPFSATSKSESPALSARSDPSFLASVYGSSPETPRRQGLAGGRTSTWSRWTEWEEEREANSKVAPQEVDDLVPAYDMETQDGQVVPTAAVNGTGLAAEYFHACAVEQLTNIPYFECVNHSCAEQLPKLYSVQTRAEWSCPTLASPFKSPVVHDRELVLEAAKSPSTTFGDDNLSPNEFSPNVRQASRAPVIKAKAVDSSCDKGSENGINAGRPIAESTNKDPGLLSPETIDVPEPTYAAPRKNDDLPNMATVAPPTQVIEVKVTHEQLPPTALAVAAVNTPLKPAPVANRIPISSPGPMSPLCQESLAPLGAVPMSEVKPENGGYPAPEHFRNHVYHDQMPTRPAFITADTEYPPLPDRQPTAHVTVADIEATTRRLSIEERRQRHEKEDVIAKKAGGLWRGRGCFPKNGCMGRGGAEKRTKRRWVIGISLALLAIIISCIVLAITLTRPGDGTPVDSQWLNLTGFPPMPTGILTIATPNIAAEQKQCVKPTTLWSCSVPKEDRSDIGANESNQPNFRFEIRFRNGTVSDYMTIPIETKGSRDLAKGASDPFTNDLFVANPPAPPEEEQIFMGNTTDNLSAPFDGEKTPFFITFIPIFPVMPSAFNSTNSDQSTERLVRRQSDLSSEDNEAVLDALPAPAIADDGSAAPVSLLPTTPFPISQPVRLYNRGLQDEHYGFYMYYDKSIYLAGLIISANGTATTSSEGPLEADQNGGAAKSIASARCTFAQTRFKVAMYTNPLFAGTLLSSLTNENLTTPEEKRAKDKKKETESSATNFDRPGSFPYPASITLDRHGGDINKKFAYCYGMNDGQILKDNKVAVGELRGFGGTLINPAPTVFGETNGFDKGAGGIDGGTGGCGCSWQNWE